MEHIQLWRCKWRVCSSNTFVARIWSNYGYYFDNQYCGIDCSTRLFQIFSFETDGIQIGCTGWSYKGGLNSIQKNLKSSEWLKYYSQILISLKSIQHFRIPPRVVKDGMQIPQAFQIFSKISSIITHEKRLERVNSEVFSFFVSSSYRKKFQHWFYNYLPHCHLMRQNQD